MLTCQDINALSDEYLSRQLPLWQKWGFIVHLKICRDCARHVAHLRLLVQTLLALPEEAIEAKAAEDIFSKLS